MDINTNLARRTREADHSDDSNTLGGYSASQTPTADTIPVSASSGEPLLDKGWLPPVAIFHDQKAANTDGGDAISGAWRTRTLNITIVNDITACSLASNQITLPAGTYDIIAASPAYRVRQHKTRLYNISDSATLLVGSNEVTYETDQLCTRSFVRGRFILAAEKIIELQHRYAVTKTTNGEGFKCNFGEVEVYAMIEIIKVA